MHEAIAPDDYVPRQSLNHEPLNGRSFLQLRPEESLRSPSGVSYTVSWVQSEYQAKSGLLPYHSLWERKHLELKPHLVERGDWIGMKSYARLLSDLVLSVNLMGPSTGRVSPAGVPEEGISPCIFDVWQYEIEKMQSTQCRIDFPENGMKAGLQLLCTCPAWPCRLYQFPLSARGTCGLIRVLSRCAANRRR